MEKFRRLQRRKSLVFATGLLLGALIILVIRFVNYSPVSVHYHANFGVYLNGKREEFKSPKYYQEVAVCSSINGITTPQQRVHMHDNVNSVVHVHDHAVTWGSFFEVLGWQVGESLIMTDDGRLYLADSDRKVHIYINGQDYTGLTSITNMVIKNRDRLLISFGNIDKTTLKQEYQSVPNTAEHHNKVQDPAACSGNHKTTLSERYKNLF